MIYGSGPEGNRDRCENFKSESVVNRVSESEFKIDNNVKIIIYFNYSGGGMIHLFRNQTRIKHLRIIDRTNL